MKRILLHKFPGWRKSFSLIISNSDRYSFGREGEREKKKYFLTHWQIIFSALAEKENHFLTLLTFLFVCSVKSLTGLNSYVRGIFRRKKIFFWWVVGIYPWGRWCVSFSFLPSSLPPPLPSNCPLINADLSIPYDIHKCFRHHRVTFLVWRQKYFYILQHFFFFSHIGNFHKTSFCSVEAKK